MDNAFHSLMEQLPPWFMDYGQLVPQWLQRELTELRLFVRQPPVWVSKGRCRILGGKPLTQQQMDELFYWICQCSVHSHQRELCEGFVTLQGGQRAGICGTAVYRDTVQTGLRDISSMSIRISRPWTGCAEQLYQRMKEYSLERGSFLLAGAPACGKTSLLRDYVRILASGENCCAVAVLDERGELSAFDLGVTAHVLNGIPKEKAILQSLRTLSPQVIVCDEIGSVKEARALLQGLNGGSRFIASIHASSWEELKQKQQFSTLLSHRALDAVVLLNGAESPGQIKEVIPLKEVCYAHHRLRTGFSMDNDVRFQPKMETATKL